MSKKGKTESTQQVEVLLSFVRDCKKIFHITMVNSQENSKFKFFRRTQYDRSSQIDPQTSAQNCCFQASNRFFSLLNQDDWTKSKKKNSRKTCLLEDVKVNKIKITILSSERKLPLKVTMIFKKCHFLLFKFLICCIWQLSFGL